VYKYHSLTQTTTRGAKRHKKRHTYYCHSRYTKVSQTFSVFSYRLRKSWIYRFHHGNYIVVAKLGLSIPLALISTSAFNPTTFHPPHTLQPISKAASHLLLTQVDPFLKCPQNIYMHVVFPPLQSHVTASQISQT
jgi:hypothetical protein